MSKVPRSPTSDVPALIVTAQDHARLAQVIDTYGGGRLAGFAADLDDELARATIVDQTAIPPDIVTMNSTLAFRFTDTGEEREVTLVYPDRADVAAGRISILAPVGTALLGLRAGQSIMWSTPQGERPLQVVAVRYQPEAAGDLHS